MEYLFPLMMLVAFPLAGIIMWKIKLRKMFIELNRKSQLQLWSMLIQILTPLGFSYVCVGVIEIFKPEIRPFSYIMLGFGLVIFVTLLSAFMGNEMRKANSK